MTAETTRFTRFIEAQDPVVDRVLAELSAGAKTSHWMWFVFPQLAALGRSERARFYGLADLAEAEAYLSVPVLRDRLVAATEAALTGRAGAVPPRTAHAIFHSPDDLKFRSCLTLFGAAAASPEVIREAMDAFFDAPCAATLSLIGRTPG